MLAGGINLARDPRNGRNFEYYSEDPCLSAVLGAEAVNGIQGEGVISTLKHYTLNCNETNRHWLDAIIDPAAHRESDLLAFQIAIERSQPGSIMTGYNKINGDYAGGNHHLLNDVLKGAWGYKGWVMSDWGATPEWDFALKGLDQESGVQVDVMMWKTEPFTEPLRKAYAEGKFPKERLSDMVRRILRSMYAVGIDKWGPAPTVDMAKHNEIAARGRPAGHRAAEERRRRAAARHRQAAQDRGDRRLRAARCADRHRLERGRSRWVVTRASSRSAARASWGGAQPLPPALVAARGAEEAPAQGADRVRSRADARRRQSCWRSARMWSSSSGFAWRAKASISPICRCRGARTP